MKCPKCGSDEFVYQCSCCGSIFRRFNDETITMNKSIMNDKRTIAINKSITNDKQHDDCYEYNTGCICPKCGSVMYYKPDGKLYCEKCEKSSKTTYTNNTIKFCPSCGNSMTLQTDGRFICDKCGLISTTDTYPSNIFIPIDGNMLSTKGISSPNEVKIITDKITITEKSTDIQMDISKQNLDNIDTIIINGVKYSKENSPENSTVSLADIDKAINTMSNLDYLNRVIIPKLWDIKPKKVKDENIQSIKNDTNFVMNLLRTIKNERMK